MNNKYDRYRVLDALVKLVGIFWILGGSVMLLMALVGKFNIVDLLISMLTLVGGILLVSFTPNTKKFIAHLRDGRTGRES